MVGTKARNASAAQIARQRDARPLANHRGDERLLEGFPLLCLLQIAQAEMGAEIDAEAEEQHQEGDGDQVEAADRDRRKAGGPDRTDDERDQQRGDEPAGPDADDEAQRDEDEGEPARIERAGKGVVQLLLPEHRLAGDADLDVRIFLDDLSDRSVQARRWRRTRGSESCC